jgi:hypothetical protein
VTVDAYLAELERALPRAARRRALNEAREHLRDSAARYRADGAPDFEAEAAATRDFGPVYEVAHRVSAELAIRDTRLAALLALGAVLAFVFPLYVIPENSLPPAGWAEVPSDIHALQRVSIGLWLLAAGLAAASVLLAWTRRPRLTALGLLATAIAITAAMAAGSAVALRWIQETPSNPNHFLSAPFAAMTLGICAAAALWVFRRRSELASD